MADYSALIFNGLKGIGDEFAAGRQQWQGQQNYAQQLGFQQDERTYQHSRDTVADQHWNADFELQKQAAARAAAAAGRESLVNAGGGMLYDPNTRTWITAPDSGGGAPLFDGKSVDASALNYLVKTGRMTPDQAAQFAAGRPMTDPSTGEIKYMTPGDVYPQAAAPVPQGSAAPDWNSLFADAPVANQPAALSGGRQAAPAPQQSAGPVALSGPKKPTADQYNAATFSDRLLSSGATIDKLQQVGTDGTQMMLAQAPMGFGNGLVSSDYQQLQQAERDFVNAVLRRESGAAISQSEFDNARQQYFPQWGDTPETLAQKAKNRAIVISGMGRAAGPAYQAPPPSDEGWQDAGKGYSIRQVQ